jgi:hypothetical protein
MKLTFAPVVKPAEQSAGLWREIEKKLEKVCQSSEHQRMQLGIRK